MTVMNNLYYGSWKTDSFEDGIIKLDHEFWASTSGLSDVCRWGIGHIIITNVSSRKATLTNVSVLMDMDDNSVNWDAFITTDGCTRASDRTFILGTIMPGATSKFTYAWTFRSLNNEPMPETAEYFFNIMPIYTVNYGMSDAFQSKGQADCTK